MGVTQTELPREFSLWSVFTRPELNRTVKDVLDVRLRGARERKFPNITVTDLLNPAEAYQKRVHPEIAPSIERLERMRSGTGFHDLFGAAVAGAEFREQLVEADGVVGKLDIFEDVPTELKTTQRAVRKADLPKGFASWIEQLGLYCWMTGKENGRLIVRLRGIDDRPVPLDVYDMRFDDLDAIGAEARRRRDLLADAVARGDPGKLPRCAYFDRGCDYRGVCDCAGEKAAWVSTIAERARDITPNPELAREFAEKVARVRPKTTGLNALVFPRKCFLEEQAAATPVEDAAEETESGEGLAAPLTEMDKYGLQRALARDIFASRGGETTFKACAFEGVEARVRLHQSVPTLFRVSPFERVVEPGRSIQTWQHYWLRLAFECAMASVAKGRLVVYFKNTEKDLSRLVVYEATVRDIEAVRAEMKRRADALAAARAAGPAADPKTLPACPPWMSKFCAFAEKCGCGSGGA